MPVEDYISSGLFNALCYSTAPLLLGSDGVALTERGVHGRRIRTRHGIWEER